MKNIIEKNPPHKHTACQTKILKERENTFYLKSAAKLMIFFKLRKQTLKYLPFISIKII